jgi:hypothetical protein
MPRRLLSDAKPADSKPTEAATAAAAKPAEKAEASNEAAIPDEGSVPSFDIVRVEPTGETVVAGLAAPKSKVELMDGSAPIATAEANERGEWAMAIEKPLSPGTHDLSIRTTSVDKKTESLSEQSVAVQVQEPGKGEALVVLNTPDAASKILQKPEVAGDTQIAAATPSAPAGTEAPTTPENTAAAPGATAKPDAVAQTDVPAKTDAPAKAADTLAETDKAANPEAKPDVASAAPADATTAEQPASTPDTKAPDTKTAEVAPPAAAPQITVDAVEVEDGKTFVAGSAKTSAPVRVYVDEKPIGEAKPGEGGRWLLETPTPIEPGRRVVRADQVETGFRQGRFSRRGAVRAHRRCCSAFAGRGRWRRCRWRQRRWQRAGPAKRHHPSRRQSLEHFPSSLRSRHPLLDDLRGQRRSDPQSGFDLSRPDLRAADGRRELD